MVYTADRAAIGKAMAGCFTDEDFSIVGGAGAQPYYARMRGIDVSPFLMTMIPYGLTLLVLVVWGWSRQSVAPAALGRTFVGVE